MTSTGDYLGANAAVDAWAGFGACAADIAGVDDDSGSRRWDWNHSFPMTDAPSCLAIPPDSAYPVGEQLPRGGRVRFVAGLDATGLVTNTTYLDDRQVGDVLTDACSEADGYRFHDCLHLAFAFILGWSPVTRALLGLKRRSNPAVDATEDGGRAIAVEEGVAALVFAHQAAGTLFVPGASLSSEDAFTQLHPVVLETAAIMVRPFEVADRSSRQWASAIVTGLRAMAAADAAGGGVELNFDASRNVLTVLPVERAAATLVGAGPAVE